MDQANGSQVEGTLSTYLVLVTPSLSSGFLNGGLELRTVGSIASEGSYAATAATIWSNMPGI